MGPVHIQCGWMSMPKTSCSKSWEKPGRRAFARICWCPYPTSASAPKTAATLSTTLATT